MHRIIKPGWTNLLSTRVPFHSSFERCTYIVQIIEMASWGKVHSFGSLTAHTRVHEICRSALQYRIVSDRRTGQTVRLEIPVRGRPHLSYVLIIIFGTRGLLNALSRGSKLIISGADLGARKLHNYGTDVVFGAFKM